jgi:translocation and assembly module TamA
VRFEGSQVEVALLQKTIPFERGEPYHQRDLLALNQRLTELDYFGYIDVRPDPETAEGDEVPVVVALTPGKRSIYTAGLSYGTDAGPGVQLGLETALGSTGADTSCAPTSIIRSVARAMA